jgi:DNA-binding NarL/FixJ family response regulator
MRRGGLSFRVLEAETGGRAVELAGKAHPDVVLLDPELRDMLGLEAVRQIGAVSPSSRVVVFPAQVTPSIREHAVEWGVHGLLNRRATPDHFVAVIDAIANGERIVEEGRADALQRAAAKLRTSPLTPREHEIFRHAARGESNPEIAKAVALAPATVKSYVQSALVKLQARNRAEAVFKLSELGLL